MDPYENEEYTTPHRERKNNRFKHLTQAYLPGLMLAVALVGVILIIAGAIRGSKGGDGKKDPGLRASQSTLSSEAQSLKDEADALLTRASALAAQYDYDGALSVLKTFSGDASQQADLQQAVSDYTAAKDALILWEDNSTIAHFSIQPLVADTARAFDNDANASDNATYHFTVAQFTEILRQLYDNGYVLVSMSDVASPVTDADGNVKYEYGAIYLPKGKKPLVLSEVPVNYYLDMVDGDDDGSPDAAGDGYACRLALTASGALTAEMVDGQGQTVQGLYDVVPVLEDFIAQHPDFSYHGARAVLGMTGYEGVLGYRSAADQATAQSVAAALKDAGYEFACFSYGDVYYGDADLSEVEEDLKSWKTNVEPILGQVQIMFYVTGSDIAYESETYSGEKYDAMYAAGFRYFVGLDNDPWATVTEEYVRQGRTTVNPAKLVNNPEIFSGYFNAPEITAIKN